MHERRRKRKQIDKPVRRGASLNARHSRAALLLLPLTGLLCGCPEIAKRGPSVPPRDLDEALYRVNANAEQIEGTVRSAALVSFRFRDGDGMERRFMGYEARLLYRAPRCLRFEVRSLAGVIAELGSNDDRYWMWIDPEVRKLWWGTWEAAADRTTAKLPISPADLMDALGLTALPERLSDSLRPILRIDGDDHRLQYVRLRDDGEAAGVREIKLQPFAPHQPVEIVDRDLRGQVLMHARLDNYERIGGSGPFTPRKYVIDWPLASAELRVDITGTRLTPELVDFCEFPTRWDGAVERLDQPAAEVGRAQPRSQTP